MKTIRTAATAGLLAITAAINTPAQWDDGSIWPGTIPTSDAMVQDWIQRDLGTAHREYISQIRDSGHDPFDPHDGANGMTQDHARELYGDNTAVDVIHEDTDWSPDFDEVPFGPGGLPPDSHGDSGWVTIQCGEGGCVVVPAGPQIQSPATVPIPTGHVPITPVPPSAQAWW